MTLEYLGEAHETPTVLMRGRLEGWGWKRQRDGGNVISEEEFWEHDIRERDAGNTHERGEFWEYFQWEGCS